MDQNINTTIQTFDQWSIQLGNIERQPIPDLITEDEYIMRLSYLRTINY